MRVRILEAAVDEIAEASAHYLAIREELGLAFEQAFRDAINAIVANPEISAVIARGVRRRPLPVFPYGIVYAVIDDEIVVGAVMHLARRPGYWRSRFREK